LVPSRIVRVDPARIARIAVGTFVPSDHSCPPTVAGDWDLTSPPTDGYGFYDDLRAVAAGAPWESTRVYRRANECFRAGVPFVPGVGNLEELRTRFCSHYDGLLDSIRANGYISQDRLARLKPRGYKALSPDEVKLAVGRDGSILVREGRHRVACAAVLEVSEIPAQILFRHPHWMAVRQRIANHAVMNEGTVPQPILHPDLDDIPAARACDIEFERLQDVLCLHGGKLVDLSPRWGYFCHRFERIGLTCTAICNRPEDEWFLRTLRAADQRAFEIVAVDEIHAGERFDLALALDWADGAPDGDRAVTELLSLVSRVEATTLVVRVHPTVGGTPGGTFIAQSDGLLDALAQAGGFSARSLVLETDAHGEVYRLSRG